MIYIINSHIKKHSLVKYIGICIALCLLSGCLGGTVAQQIARSIVTSIADKATASALDVNEDEYLKPQQNAKLKDKGPDARWMALATTRFDAPTSHPKPLASAIPKEVPIQILQASSLVRVQLFNLLIGEEKEAIFEKARTLGSLNLPDKREWPSWHVATGMIEKENTLITFLIPPTFGKLSSGTFTMVELAKPGELNIARYLQN
jgi:hypothetical protein